MNFLSYWDGDAVRELLDGTHIDKYGTGGDTRLLTGSDVHSNNGTKSTPSLSGDILGDWREEVIWPTSANNALRIYSTPTQTGRRVVTLLHDPQYREAIAWQNTAYNQPPHPSFAIQ
ncbi:MAG TPA: rhamnogalacturonan lyase, partial [Actinoplanes sp.]|nr:rhamnogalacturonan lyase [Actinoplanes sp.]